MLRPSGREVCRNSSCSIHISWNRRQLRAFVLDVEGRELICSSPVLGATAREQNTPEQEAEEEQTARGASDVEPQLAGHLCARAAPATSTALGSVHHTALCALHGTVPDVS